MLFAYSVGFELKRKRTKWNPQHKKKKPNKNNNKNNNNNKKLSNKMKKTLK